MFSYFIPYSPESPQESSIDGDKEKVSPVSGGYTAGMITKITTNFIKCSTHTHSVNLRHCVPIVSDVK